MSTLMPGKHEHHHGPNGHKPKHDGPPRGPKERELAVALTVAVLRAAKVEGSLEDVEGAALRTYNRMLDGITDAPAFAPALPPTATIGTSN
jgi:hypothetical protein